MNPLSTLILQLLKRDLVVLKKEYGSKLFDTSFIFFTNVVVFGYFMTKQGLQADYGPFLMIGAIASFGLFDVMHKVSMLLSDLEGPKTLSFLLTLPLTSNALFCTIALSWSINSLLITLPLFVLGKILLFHRFDLGAISYWRLLIMLLSANLFYGFFSLWLSGIIRGMSNLGSIFCRYINPIFMFGSYFYSWKNAFAMDHLIGYLSLFNPLVYVMEGMRSATLDPNPYLPFWICPLALGGFILLLGWHGIRTLKKRIDCL